ncbi:hypothetical protein G7Y89_g13733 [Cudoniella acicularis]|uniref:Uncharacterized protein n=1 Tax=Cudoniella acicularis TaxID=354080 RepID=A0A8H4R8Q6_9HELO|nr:hypothetical protein G7Y89_g13733 [Cudoniella acicularis]
MLFTTLSVSALGFAAVSFAAPQLHSRFEVEKREPAQPVERGLTWTPHKRSRGNFQLPSNSFNSFGSSSNNFFNDFNSFSQSSENTIIITEIQENSLSESEFESEQQFSQLIQEQLFLDQSQNFISDNIRRNHFNSRNSNVNTIILIVSQVTDSRNGGSNSRYFSRQIESNSNIQEQEVVIITDSNQFNIGGSNSNSQFVPSSTSVSQAQSTGIPSTITGSQSNVGLYQPGASWQGFNPNIQLLPSGISEPSFNFGQSDTDPAIIILENQQTYVEFLEQSEESLDSSILSESQFSGFNSEESNSII